jgi:hypothetical protein
MAKNAIAAIPGFGTALQLYRTGGNTDTNPISLGQVLESADSVRCQGQQLTLSFWAQVSSPFSGGAFAVKLVSGTGSNQSAAALVSGGWTSQVSVISATQTFSNTWTRYQWTGTVPAGCTQLGFFVQYTPAGTAGTSGTDYVQFAGFQLEVGNAASAFEHRDAQVELEICQRYAWVTAEPAAGVVVGSGMNTSAGAQLFYMATPVQMYKAPAVSVSAGTFKTNQAGTATATTITPGTTHIVNAISVLGSSTGTAGQGTLLQGGGGSGYIVASADF